MRIVSITRRFLLRRPVLRTGCYGTSRSAKPYRILLIFAEIAMGGAASFHFGRFTLEVAVTHGTTVIHHSPKAFDVLVLLVRQAGRLVTKNDLLSQVWPDACVGSRHSDHLHRGAAKAFGDDKRASAFIETVPRSGYRFVAPVQQAHVKGESPHEKYVAARSAWLVSVL
jgi:DNA-binding winged helix-turn-helix (wHTH) protein